MEFAPFNLVNEGMEFDIGSGDECEYGYDNVDNTTVGHDVFAAESEGDSSLDPHEVAAAKNHGRGVKLAGTVVNGSRIELRDSEANLLGPLLSCSAIEKDQRISELANEVDSANQRCKVYQTKLLAVLKDMEQQKLKLSLKAQSVRVSLKD
ncbi:hypothetical protein IFM89_024804 [Coptis chinensis]|uniref:Uncharacterized protein n=1 Tax=Coptis chinensis TaxID=261450 RepID=A0A835LRD2_9MAGN|nr:hypothetical protein IFM89_024804 [Coptis chinensis]